MEKHLESVVKVVGYWIKNEIYAEKEDVDLKRVKDELLEKMGVITRFIKENEKLIQE